MRVGGPAYFQLLKKALGDKYALAHPGASNDISSLKGEEIVRFQEHLSEVVQGRISEKWFYTHLKRDDNEKLPRIDVLNMLSRYIGYDDWQAFMYAQELPESIDQKSTPKIAFLPKLTPWAIGLAAIGLIILGTFWAASAPPDYSVCFIDADNNEAVKRDQVEVLLLKKDQTPARFELDENGCLSLLTDEETMTFVVKGAYYRNDTIVRHVSATLSRETISLKTDDYALMIHYFSNAKVEDWHKRRAQLDEIFADDARIFQVLSGTQRGMEMYNKQEFIDKLTMPIQSLKNIEILETEYRDEQIVNLRFIQK